MRILEEKTKYPWRALLGVHRGGEEKKKAFRNILNKVFETADSNTFGLITIPYFSPSKYTPMSTQQHLVSYYERRGFIKSKLPHNIKRQGYYVYIRYPNK